jgi:sortase (surface protein transpeptidase)
VAALALAACGGEPSAGQAESSSVRPSATASTSAPSASPSSRGSSAFPSSPPAYRAPRDYAAVAAPVRLRIPAIGVRTSLERLGRGGDGTVEVPKRWERAGWYTEGFRPGQPGPAVILGHVDSRSGPAVFFKLRNLRPGASVLVDRADGTTVRFRVTGVERYRKTRFPSDLVYFPTLEPSLRLVTCGGTFDATSGHYRDNVIALATAV